MDTHDPIRSSRVKRLLSLGTQKRLARERESELQNISESRSSKRVLDFASLPLYGKVFFLDLPRVKSESLATLAEKITHLGGTVEKFFHEAVCYLVTLRHMEGEKEGKEQTAASPDTRVKSGGKSAGMTSQQRSYNMRHEMLTQRALFCNRTNKKRGTLSQHFVTSVVPPLSPLEGSKSKKRAHDGYSGAKNVALSKQKGEMAVDILKKKDILKKAEEWGVKLLTPDQLIAQLKTLLAQEGSEGENQDKKQHGESSPPTVPSVRELKPPFIKVEDRSGNYRPLIYETEKWPLPNYDCPPDASPYDTVRKNGKSKAQIPRATGARLTQDFVASLPGPAVASACAAKRKPGYCECCVMRYEDLKLHLQSKMHRQYATNQTNFNTVDKFAEENHLTLDSYINSFRAWWPLSSGSSEPHVITMNQVSPPNSALASPPGNSAIAAVARRSPQFCHRMEDIPVAQAGAIPIHSTIPAVPLPQLQATPIVVLPGELHT